MGTNTPQWHKSTYSGGGANCVEVAENLPGVVLVRDTKQQGNGPVLAFEPAAWNTFLTALKHGQYDRH